MGRRASLHNLGCKVNAYETEAMEQLLKEAGYTVVAFGEPADVCIINTCSVTNVADKKSRQMLHRARVKNPGACVVAVGCYVQAAAAELEKDGSADILIGNNRKKDLVGILADYFREQERQEQGRQEQERQEQGRQEQKRQEQGRQEQERQEQGRQEQERQEQGGRGQGCPESVHIIDIGKTREYEELHVDQAPFHTRVPVKIQDGCDQFCSYCIIPYTRGRVRSRQIGDVVGEVEQLTAGGHKEVVLTGIHLSSYGSGLEGLEKGGPALLELLGRLQKISGLERIRLGSLEPRIVTEDFAAALAAMPKVCPHFHLSLQSGCEATLKRMGRRYTPREYQEVCSLLRRAFARPAITTDVIVGFPGETEDEFEETRRFLEGLGLYEMHIFKYSKRKGTRAAAMPDQVPEPVKARRSEELLGLERTLSRQFREGFLGQDIQVLLEEEAVIGKERYMVGHTREYVRAALPIKEGQEPVRSCGKGCLVEGTGREILTDDLLLFQLKW